MNTNYRLIHHLRQGDTFEGKEVADVKDFFFGLKSVRFTDGTSVRRDAFEIIDAD